MAKHRTFYDSTSLDDLPRRTRNLFAYIDGPYANYTEAVKRWPRRLVVPITVGVHEASALHAAIIDCEPLDADPADAAMWCGAKLHHGEIPTIYASASRWPLITPELEKLGLRYGIGADMAHNTVQRFTADYDGNPAIAPGDVAHQYLGSPGDSPGHYDVTSALHYVPGWGMGYPLTRRHRRYARALDAAWRARNTELLGADRTLVRSLGVSGAALLENQ